MSRPPAATTQRRVAEAYLRTTSHAALPAAPDASVALPGLRRRLGPWFEVAGRDLVDLGSGTGELCRLARDAGARRIVGVNLSADELAYARAWVGAGVDFVCQDAAEYLEGCANESLDVVFAMNFLEHLDKDTLVRILEASHRCLRPGGALVAMVPNATSPFGAMTRYWDITHQLAFTPSSVRQLARLTGFGEAAEFRECGPVPYGPVSVLRYLLWQGIRLLIRGYLAVELASAKGAVYTADMLVRLRKAPRGES